MLINPDLSSTIKISAKPGLKVAAGDEVFIQVIKHLVGNKWAIGFKGSVYPARTDLELYPEQIIKVKVIKAGNTVQFKIAADAKESIKTTTSPHSISAFIKNLGLPDDSLTKQIVNALISSEMAIDPVIIQKIREKMNNGKKSGAVIIRLLVNLLGKKIDISSLSIDQIDQIEELLQFPDYSSGHQEEKGFTESRKRNLSYKQLKETLKAIIAGKEGQQGNLLQVFNHLKGKEDSWVTIPFRFSTIDFFVSGNLRFLLDNINHDIKKAALIANLDNGDKWSFFISPGKKWINILVFSNKKVYIDKKSKSFNTLIANLQNIGVKIDDKIYEDKYFDGFYPLFTSNANREGYKAINTII